MVISLRALLLLYNSNDTELYYSYRTTAKLHSTGVLLHSLVVVCLYCISCLCVVPKLVVTVEERVCFLYTLLGARVSCNTGGIRCQVYSRMKNQHGRWVCWMSTGRKNFFHRLVQAYRPKFLQSPKMSTLLDPEFLHCTHTCLICPAEPFTNVCVCFRQIFVFEEGGNIWVIGSHISREKEIKS